MKEIKLTHGYKAKVDDSDFAFLNQWKWRAARTHNNGTRYAVRSQYIGNRKSITVAMHQVIMGAMALPFGDHADGDGLNNQKANLRPATRSQNGANARLRSDNTSGLKGVRPDKRRWMARINLNGQSLYLGSFSDRLSAARAYDKAARQYFGEFAKTNESMNLI